MATKKDSNSFRAPLPPFLREALNKSGMSLVNQEEDNNAAAEILRQELLHLLVDMNLNGHGKAVKLAAILSALMKKRVSRNTLCMALSGYRLTGPYVKYLQKLKDHLLLCKECGIDPVSLYTEQMKNQVEKENSHEPC